MKQSVLSVFVFVIVMVLFTGGCTNAPAPDPATNTPSLTETLLLTDTPLPTTTLLPTTTPLPTNTALPTKTPVPTRTPIPPTPTIPAPDKSLEYLDNVQIVYVDNFDTTRGGWGFDAGKVKGGVLEVIGKNWNGFVRERDFKDNQGIIVDFTYTEGSVFEMLFDSGEWYTDPYKRFGIYIERNAATVNVWVGKNGLGGAYLSGNLSPKPDTIYSLLMAVLPDGKFLGVIWDPSDPSKTIFYRENIGKNWSNLTWKYKIGADSGTILFDNYKEITFDSGK